MNENKVWCAVLQRMSDKISRMEFHTWFKKVKIAEISGEAVLLACPTEMNKNWLESKYLGIILSNIQSIMPEVNKLYLKVDLSLSDEPIATEIAEIFQSSKTPRKLPNKPEAKLDNELITRLTQRKFSLKNFVVGDGNQFAFAAFEAVLQSTIAPNLPPKYNPLFIYGGVGLGKTHLLQGLANDAREKNPNLKIIYTTSERFMNEIINAIRNRKADELRKKYRRVDLFVLDDVQFFEGKEKTQEELFNTFNDLFEFKKQVVFSADRPPSELLGISDRLRSRMGWGLQVDVQMPNFETRVAIIREKSQERGLLLSLDVQEFIATNVRTNLREIENILNQISAELDINHISPTPQSVGKIIRRLNPEREITIAENGKNLSLARSTDDVITIVSDYFQIPATSLLGNSRKKEIVFPRQIAWLLCKDVLKMSYEAIGEDFGGKNHTTIMHGIKKIQKLKRTDSMTARHIHALKKDLGVK